jgi:hypothetical protein
MKTITILILILLMPLPLYAEEGAIAGAFGLKFGERLDVEKLEKLEASAYGDGYAISPEKPYKPLHEYVAFVTLHSNKVFKIVGKGKFKSMKACREELLLLEDALSKKYIKTSGKVSDKFGDIPKIAFGKTERRITGMCVGGFFGKELVLTYLDRELEKQGKAEINKKEQSIKTTNDRDTTGL